MAAPQAPPKEQMRKFAFFRKNHLWCGWRFSGMSAEARCWTGETAPVPSPPDEVTMSLETNLLHRNDHVSFPAGVWRLQYGPPVHVCVISERGNMCHIEEGTCSRAGRTGRVSRAGWVGRAGWAGRVFAVFPFLAADGRRRRATAHVSGCSPPRAVAHAPHPATPIPWGENDTD
eukprot:gene10741-biopygen16813